MAMTTEVPPTNGGPKIASWLRLALISPDAGAGFFVGLVTAIALVSVPEWRHKVDLLTSYAISISAICAVSAVIGALSLLARFLSVDLSKILDEIESRFGPEYGFNALLQGFVATMVIGFVSIVAWIAVAIVDTRTQAEGAEATAQIVAGSFAIGMLAWVAGAILFLGLNLIELARAHHQINLGNGPQ